MFFIAIVISSCLAWVACKCTLIQCFVLSNSSNIVMVFKFSATYAAILLKKGDFILDKAYATCCYLVMYIGTSVLSFLQMA